MITDYKTLMINLGTFLFSMTNIDIFFKDHFTGGYYWLHTTQVVVTE